MKNEFLRRNLVDILPPKLLPTWENGRVKKAYIAKRIDRFILHVSLIDILGMPFSTIENVFIYDHRPIILGWREKGFRKGYSFKFNRTCLEDPEFNDIILKAWNEMSSPKYFPLLMTFRDKMESIRKVVKEWQFQKRQAIKKDLQEIQKELDSTAESMASNTLSFEMRCRIKDLQKKKMKILEQEEAFWRLKSRAIWMKEGDRNSKIFHNFANSRREKNSIWKISDGKGGFLYSQQDITNEAVEFFKNQYKRSKEFKIQDILWGIDLFPWMFDGDLNDHIFQPVSEEELLATMKSFKRDKSPGPDGWTIVFFIHFFDLIKTDLLRMDFRPISLCNISFKIVSKIVAERIKGVFLEFPTKEQHGFLKGRNIHDAVASTQEGLYAIHSKKCEAVILKIDLLKAYDCLDWGFIRCLLAKIELRSNMINWIMASVEMVDYAIIINGIPSPFFRAARFTWICYYEIIKNFQKATGLQVNNEKSTIYHNDINLDDVAWLSDLFGIKSQSISCGIKYLGFQIKANGYSKTDWQWIPDRFSRRISAWEYRCLSLVGRVILAQSVLNQLAVYWAHLYFLLASIMKSMNRVTTNFIWGGQAERRKFHLSKLSSISLPKSMGGWGLLDMRTFGKALSYKSLWRAIHGEGPWSIAI
eukprot:PITA_09171